MKQTYRTFITIGLTVAVLLFMHQLPTLTIGGIQLRPVSILSDLTQGKDDRQQIDVIPKPKQQPLLVQADTIDGKQVTFKETWPNNVVRITDYSGGQPGGMSHFYTQLSRLLCKKELPGRPVRIAYYGDSFIEGDILTADLREMLQTRYGGYGPGWIDAGNIINSMRLTISARYSGLTEHTVMKRKENGYDFGKAGICERYYPYGTGSRMTFTATDHYPHAAKWQEARLYLRTAAPPSTPEGAAIVTPTGDDKTQWTTTLQSAPANTTVIKTQAAEASPRGGLGGGMTGISYQMHGSGTLFGVGLETSNGIVVDNFSMRGSSGMTLASLPEQTLKDFARLRPYDLIVIQFGQNAVTAKGTAKQYEHYMTQMKKVVELFRKCFPEASILLVGASDRAQRGPEGLTTIRTLDLMIAAQEQAAADCKIGFYNLWQAMGGKGSIVKFVEQGMGAKDYIHINYKGGKAVAEAIYQSIVAGESNYTNYYKEKGSWK